MTVISFINQKGGVGKTTIAINVADCLSRSCIIASDVVVIPIEPSGLSTWASDVTVAQVRQAQELKPTLKCGFAVSRKLGNTVIGREIKDLVAASDIHIFKSDIESRVAVAESITMGKTKFVWQPSGKAARQFKALTKEIIDYAQEGI